jgi:ABC-type oligopeptide transport system substrate-binding subunit
MNSERVLMDDFAMIPLYYYTETVLVSQKVTGYKGSALGNHLSRWIDINP